MSIPHFSLRMFRTCMFAMGCILALEGNAQSRSVLFIGNSYTYVNDLPNTLRQLALSLGDTITVASSTPGGYTFEGHTVLQATIDAINSQAWDHVVLQEQSQRPSFPLAQVQAQVFPYATELVQMVRANEACTQPVFYMTWGRQDGDAGNCPNWPPVCTYEGMNDLLEERYVQMGEDNDSYVAPVGVAWKQARETHPLINLYQSDGSHPSLEGTYLAACVFYSTLFGEPCAASNFTAGVQPDTAAILREIADAVVLGDPAAWNLDVTDVDAWPTSSNSAAWNEITYTHGGTGTHLWTCSNGQSFTTPDATFTFTSGGAYTITHSYTDACGYTDTDSWEWLVTVTGVEELAPTLAQLIAVGNGMLEVRGARGGETLTLFDPQGRLLSSQRVDGAKARFPCPIGAHLWRITAQDGTTSSGRVIVR